MSFQPLNDVCDKLTIWHFLLIIFVLLARVVKWIVFGDVVLTPLELTTIREKFNYTLFEFVCGLLIFRNSQAESIGICDVCHYALLFASLLVLKSFHHLCDIRVEKLREGSSNRPLLYGIITLIGTDLLIFWQATNFKQTSLFMIFGYETLNLLPLIMHTLFQYKLKSSSRSRPYPQLHSYTVLLMELLMTVLRLSLFCLYTVMFNNNLTTYPVHVMPSAYKCFRLMLKNLRRLIKFKRQEYKFRRFDKLPRFESDDDLKEIRCFCLEELAKDDDITQLPCGHLFHHECVKWWLIKSETCPLCRDELAGTAVQPAG